MCCIFEICPNLLYLESRIRKSFTYSSMTIHNDNKNLMFEALFMAWNYANCTVYT